MGRFTGWLGLAAVIVLGIAFALGNAGREVTINLGIVTLNSVPVTFVAFGGMVVGMGVVLVAGINADLKVRRLLRERHMKDDLTGSGPAGPSQRTLEGIDDQQGGSLLE